MHMMHILDALLFLAGLALLLVFGVMGTELSSYVIIYSGYARHVPRQTKRSFPITSEWQVKVELGRGALPSDIFPGLSRTLPTAIRHSSSCDLPFPGLLLNL
mmetsp:Transcript_1096/g.1966  ORF Transcript_1096/g.1966 Transcript_1096/m.1966 type:complete len:102 (+) Transcript_1096:240-545(+)